MGAGSFLAYLAAQTQRLDRHVPHSRVCVLDTWHDLKNKEKSMKYNENLLLLTHYYGVEWPLIVHKLQSQQ